MKKNNCIIAIRIRKYIFHSKTVKNCLQLSFIAEKLSSTEYTTEVRVASPVQEEVVHHLRRHLHHPEGNLYDQQRDTFSITDVTKYIYVNNRLP